MTRTGVERPDPSYAAIVRCDPCAYCGGPGGTVDHLDPRPVVAGAGRGAWTNLTGACEACNRKKDKGNGQHRSVLAQLLAVLEGRDRARRELVRTPGTAVAGPFFDRGVVVALERVGQGGTTAMVIAVPGRAEPWRCYSWRALRPVA